MGLVDLHSHILPGVDDGALDLRDSLAMARQAQGDGIDVVVATPHVRADHAVRIGEIGRRCEEVNDILACAGLAVRVAPGAEVAEPIVDELDAGELHACTLGGGGRWILLEPAAGPLSDRTERTVASLHAAGFGVLLAHPERHLSADLVERLRALAGAGVLIQLTAAFAAEPHARALLEHGLVHVLGSDAHSSHGGRRVALTPAIAHLRAVPRLAPHVDWMTRVAPRAILAGEALTAPY